MPEAKTRQPNRGATILRKANIAVAPFVVYDRTIAVEPMLARFRARTTRRCELVALVLHWLILRDRLTCASLTASS
jgi:hypothetical protein